MILNNKSIEKKIISENNNLNSISEDIERSEKP